MNIINAINALNHKIEVVTREIGIVDVTNDGLLSKSEASAAITGLVGGKGALPDGTDLNDVTHGGIYYLPAERNYKNIPFVAATGNYRMQLTVVNNYTTQVRTNDPLIYQEVKTIEQSGDIKIAYRFKYNGWINWYFESPNAKVLWDGTQGTRDTVFQLTQPYTDFYKLRIFWGPYNTGMTSEEIRTFSDNISLHAINAPNTAGSSPALSVEEVNLVGSADKKTLTSHAVLYYIQNGVTYSDTDSGKSVIYSIIGYNSH